jgi:hypothetical protein
MHQVSLISASQEGLGTHRRTNLHRKINLCLAPIRDDLKTKIPKNYTYALFDGCNLRNLCSSRIRHLLTKVAMGSCHVNQDQIIEGLLLGDRYRNYRLGITFLYKRCLIRGIET